MLRRPYTPVIHAATIGRLDEEDTIISANAVAAALERSGYRAEVIGIGADLDRIDSLKRRQPLAVFNVVEAIEADSRRAWLAAARVERKRMALTGSSAAALRATQSKLECKARLKQAGLPTPAWIETGATSAATEFDAAADTPVILKPSDEHASVGIDPTSVVSLSDARPLLAEREAHSGARYLAETFIEGREFNLSLLETPHGIEVLPIPEILFEDFAADQPRIVDYAAKWDDSSHAYHHTPRRFGLEASEPALAADLSSVAKAVWSLFGISGYARIDFRVDAAGRPFVIDINTNPCVAPDAGFAAAAFEGGIGYDDLVARIVAVAVERAERRATADRRRRSLRVEPGDRLSP